MLLARPIDDAQPANITLEARWTSNKRGLAFNTASYTSLFGGFGSQVTWGYDWGQTDVGFNTNLEFTPMLWSDNSDLTSTWAANVEAALAAGTSHLLLWVDRFLAHNFTRE